MPMIAADQSSSAGNAPDIANGLYTISVEMQEGKRGRATGVVVLCDGRIMGGDSHFYYTGAYTCKNGKWRGETINHQHAEAPGINLAFGGRDVPCGFTGTYSHGEAEIDATALVGKTSVMFRAWLVLRQPI
jgi:hypothetical protein